MLKEEGRVALRLLHDNLVETFFVDDHDGDPLLVMEFLSGRAMSQVLGQAKKRRELVPLDVSLALLRAAACGLHFAHTLTDRGRPLGLIHRDVSPANLFVTFDGRVKVIDFGVAKADDSEIRTSTGILKGKLGYMAPEYTLGRLDHRADLFAVGVIAHELLTGKRLFDNPNDFEIITMLREMPIQPPSRWNPQVGLALDDIVMTALSRDPGLRWQSAAAMRAALVNAGGELKLLPSRDGLAKWCEWAFTQQPRKDVSGLSQVIDMLGDPSDQRAITIEPDMVLTPTPTPITRRDREPTPATTVVPAKLGVPRNSGVFETEGVIVGRSVLPVAHHRARLRPWLLFMLLLAVAGGSAYWYLLLRK